MNKKIWLFCAAVCCCLAPYAACAEGNSGIQGGAENIEVITVKNPPKDGNEGTYPTHKEAVRAVKPAVQTGADEALRAGNYKKNADLKPPKDGNEGTYPIYRFNPSKQKKTDITADESAVKDTEPAAEPVREKRGSVPFLSKNIEILTKERCSELGLPLTIKAFKALCADPQLKAKTPDYSFNQSTGNIEIRKKQKFKVYSPLRMKNGRMLLLAAFHLPLLPDAEEAERIWLIKPESEFTIADMGDLGPGIYRFAAAALNADGTPAAKPNLSRMVLRYGFGEAMTDYKDRQFLLYGDTSRPSGFGDVAVADAADDLPVFKIVPSVTVLKPGEKIVLTAERLPSKEERRLARIHQKYGLKASADASGVEKDEQKPEQSAEQNKKKPFRWSLSGAGRLEVISENSAVYYAPHIDATGAEVRCWEDGDDSFVTASVYVTTMPIGEVPKLDEVPYFK